MLAHSLAQSPHAPAGQRFHSLGFQDDLGFQKKALPLHQINSLADSPPAPQQGPPTLHLEPKGILTKKKKNCRSPPPPARTYHPPHSTGGGGGRNCCSRQGQEELLPYKWQSPLHFLLTYASLKHFGGPLSSCLFYK